MFSDHKFTINITVECAERTQSFKSELNDLKKAKLVYSKSSLLALDPFLDENHIIVVE